MIRYYNESCNYSLPKKRLTSAWLKSLAQQEGYALGEVNYIFCSAEHLLEMNRQFLGHDYFTDVITFDYSDRKVEKVVSGDVFIDVETVADNALPSRPLLRPKNRTLKGVNWLLFNQIPISMSTTSSSLVRATQVARLQLRLPVWVRARCC